MEKLGDEYSIGFKNLRVICTREADGYELTLADGDMRMENRSLYPATRQDALREAREILCSYVYEKVKVLDWIAQ